MVTNSKNTDRIVSAAIDLFRRKGYSSVMVKDICREAGVSTSSFYFVFSGKDDVLLCLLRGHKGLFKAVTSKTDVLSIFQIGSLHGGGGVFAEHPQNAALILSGLGLPG